MYDLYYCCFLVVQLEYVLIKYWIIWMLMCNKLRSCHIHLVCCNFWGLQGLCGGVALLLTLLFEIGTGVWVKTNQIFLILTALESLNSLQSLIIILWREKFNISPQQLFGPEAKDLLGLKFLVLTFRKFWFSYNTNL